MVVSSPLCRGGGLVMGLLVCAAVSLVVPAAATGGRRTSMEMNSDGGEMVRRMSEEDPCGGVCEGLGRSCVVATEGREFCVDCSGLLRRRVSGTATSFAECCNYNPWKMRCGQALRDTARGKCLRSENLFVRTRPAPVPARLSRNSGNACGKPWDFRNNGLACGLTRPRNGRRRCINADGTEQQPPQCSTSFVQVGADIVPDPAAADEFGRSVAMSADGSRLAIGVPYRTGYVQVFELQESEGWVQVGEDIDGESQFDASGQSVAMSADGSRVAIGAPFNNGNRLDSGHVRVFELQESEGWVQVGEDIDGESRFDNSGRSVAMSADGRRVAIGAPFNNGGGNDFGHVRVFELQESEGWVQVGEDIDGRNELSTSGWSVAMSADGSRVAIGAPDDRSGLESGHVRVFELHESEGWVQVGEDIDGKSAGSQTGWSVAMSADGSRVAIGSPESGTGSDGHVGVFELQESDGWVQVGEDIVGESALGGWGRSVAMSADGSRVAFGGPLNTNGRVLVFQLQKSEGWIQIGEDIDGEGLNNLSGSSVAMSADGSRVAIGAPSAFDYVKHVRVVEAMKQCR